MAYEVVMPRLGWNMEAGSLAEWRKRDGEPVEVGEILFTIESDKAIQEVEALEGGILRIPPDSPPVGKLVPVGTLLAYLVKVGEPLPFQAGTAVEQPVVAAVYTPNETDPFSGMPLNAPARSARHFPAASPRAVRVAAELGVDWTRLKGSGRTGRIVERDVRQAAAAPAVTESLLPEVHASPLARRAAEELGVDLSALAARMPGKRIERADVETAAQTGRVVSEAPVIPAPGIPPVSAVSQPSRDRLVPISPVRRIIAERMSASAHTAAPLTITTEVDATELVRLRKQLKEDGSTWVPSYTDLLAKIVASALIEHPQVNARYEGDAILQMSAVNIGIAVDTDRGLLAPVLRDVQSKALLQIAQESAALIEQARNGSLRPEDLHGGTFTITNLGMYEIDAFTPIINLPECAILGVGRILPKPVVVDSDTEKVAVRHMLPLSLTFDHRLLDGGPAARFLQRVKQYIEKPYLWLVKPV